MRKKKVKINYEVLRLDELHTLAGKVMDCMRQTTIFDDLPIEIGDLEVIIQDFQQKWQTAKNGGSKWDKAVKDESRMAMIEAFRQLAIYVNQKADGNVPNLLSSGFYLEDDPKALPLPGIPLLVELLDGPQRGQLATKFQKVPKAWLYEYQVGHLLDENGEPQWGETVVTRKTMHNIIAPVIAGQTYYVRVRSRNGTGVSDWSAVVSLLAR
jgi:hypothetical protein